MSNHSGYRGIDATPFGDTERVTSGEAIEFGGNGAKGRNGGTGTLGFYGRDLGSSRPTEGRVPAFLALAERTGGVYVENPPTVAEGLKRAGLDFEVRHDTIVALRQQDVLAVGDDGQPRMEREPTGEQLPVGEWVATVAYPRDGGQPFGIAPTSKRYTIVQNDDMLSAGEAISGGRLRALGAFGNPRGSRVYGAWELGDGFSVGGGDPYRNFVTLVNTHDRNGGYGVMAPIRLGCTNQQTATFGRQATPRFTIRHTGDATVKIAEARRILGLAHQYVEVLQETSEALLAAKMSTDQFLSFARTAWGVTDEEKLTDRSKNIVKVRDEELLAILAGQTCGFGEGTAYAAVQAVTEHMQHFGVVRTADPAQKRAERLMMGQLDKATDRAWNLGIEFANA